MLEEIFGKLKLIFIPCQDNKYRPKFLASQFLTYYLIILLILKFLTIPIFIYFPKTIFFADISKISLINLTNKEREELGIQPLKENLKLNTAATLKAMDILEKDYFSHQSPQGISPWYWFKEAGYDYKFAGENLAIGFLDSKEVIQAWKESLLHKKNLLDPNYQEIGIAVMKGDFKGNETTVVVQLLGTTQPLPTEKPEVITKLPEKEILPEKKEISAEKEVLPEKEEIVAEETPPQVEEKVVEEKVARDKLTFNFFAFFTSDYFNLLQKIIYSSLILIIISLVINIFVRIDIQHRDLIFKTLGFVVLLLLFLFIDEITIIKLIPHNFEIY
jgi:hypothetical protein